VICSDPVDLDRTGEIKKERKGLPIRVLTSNYQRGRAGGELRRRCKDLWTTARSRRESARHGELEGRDGGFDHFQEKGKGIDGAWCWRR
jgi:hypothetical protein